MIDQHTLDTLEFPKVIAHISGKCLTPYGKTAVAAFSPMSDKPAIESRLNDIAEMQDILKFGTAFPLYRLEDCLDILDAARVDGVFLPPDEIRRVLELVEVSIGLYQYDRESRDNFPHLTEYLIQIRAFPELAAAINQAIDETGEIKDSASQALRRIRRELAESKRRILSRLENILSAKQKTAGWQDDVITQRNDRYVIPIVASQYRSDQGILHDRSQSGATFYIEPQETVELNNRVNLLMQEERNEIVRILRALTAEISARVEGLINNTRLIGHLDAVYGSAKAGNELECHRPVICDKPLIDLIDSRHPLLILQTRSVKNVVPLTLRLDDDRRALIMTGPNTGGKTIALKTVGLSVLMALSGLPIPADAKSSVGLFDKVFADIGDEQSIELSLSTFSSHIRNIIRATDKVSPRTLVLLDEIGAGTDPKEGAALAEAIVTYLVDRGAILVTSTHYSQLKTLALDRPQVENASLEFDRETLAPTYRLKLGIPGSSYAIEIAGRLGMPKEICKQSTELLGEGERSLADLIASLEAELSQVRTDKMELTDRLAKARELEERYRQETEKFKEEIDRARAEALEETTALLNESRRETERLVAEIRKSQADKDSVKEIHHFLQKQTQQADGIRRRQAPKKNRAADPDSFGVGDTVRIISLNQEGILEELSGKSKARVRVGSMNTWVELRNLEKLKSAAAPRQVSSGVGSMPSVGEMSPELHLRGMTVDEARDAVDRFLDQAVVAGLHQAYVIHGKGTGALRRSLSEYLKSHPEVASIRLGNWNEGGAGVTVVKLKK